MGFYAKQVVPRIINAVCGMKEAERLRRRVCEGLEGDVLEIGFGSGLNVPFYSEAVTRVDAVEPSDVGWKLAGKRLATTPVRVERTGLDGQVLPFADHSFDAALSTWTLCTIPDADAALHEVRRVLKPGGTLHFIEHGLAPAEDECAPLAAATRPHGTAALRRMPPDPADRRHADHSGLRHHRPRRLLREGRPEADGCRLPRHRRVPWLTARPTSGRRAHPARPGLEGSGLDVSRLSPASANPRTTVPPLAPIS